MYGIELTIILRTLHVLGGIFWVGGAIISVGFLVPAIQASGPEGMKVMRQIMVVRKMPIYFNVAAVVSILSGFWLYARNIHLSDGVWASSTSGMVFGLGGMSALLAAILGGALMAPTGRKLAVAGQQLQAEGSSPSPESIATVERLGNRMRKVAQINTALLLLAATAMAVGRYL